MLEKDSFIERHVSSTDKQEEKIQRFIECLQNHSLQDYDHFIKLLYITKQEPLITKLVSSCKIICCNFIPFITFHGSYIHCFMHESHTMSTVLTDAELYVNTIPTGKEDSKHETVCRITFDFFRQCSIVWNLI